MVFLARKMFEELPLRAAAILKAWKVKIILFQGRYLSDQHVSHSKAHISMYEIKLASYISNSQC
jgi:hypothetical protein